MSKVGFNNLATNVALRNLLASEYVRTSSWEADGIEREYVILTEKGWKWIAENAKSLNLKSNPLDDEIPF